MNKRFNLHSLRYRMIIALVVSLAIAGAVFFLLTTTTNYLIVKYYLSAEAYDSRAAAYAERFQNHVQKEGLRSTDSTALQEWVRQNPYTYISLYDRSGVVWESGWWDAKNAAAQEHSSSEMTAVVQSDAFTSGDEATSVDLPEYYEWFYQTEFSDGTFWISITDFSDEPLYEITRNTVIAFSVFLVFPIVLIYSGKISRRVIRLTREVGFISSGHLDGPITKSGQDEVASLAEGVDTMRRSVIEQLEKEQIAWRANSDLITSMSHDIRTPLTVLLGYTGLIKNKQYKSEAELAVYIDVIDKKAVQLKELSDKLFRYFLVFGDTGALTLQTVSAKDLLSQAMGEHVVLLSDNGFQFQGVSMENDCRILIEPNFFRRLFDNIFSNIEKYGDLQVPCTVSAMQDQGQLTVRITNGIKADSSQAESTKIGLKTCARSMEQMGGSFTASADSGFFTVTLRFPLADGKA